MEPLNLIATYIQSRGLTSALSAFKNELKFKFSKEVSTNVEVWGSRISSFFHNMTSECSDSAYFSVHRHLLSFVNNSLSCYRADLNKILLPLFIYMYLELVEKGQRESACSFYEEFKHKHTSFPEISMLKSIDSERDLDSDSVLTLLECQYYIPMSKASLSCLISFIERNNYSLLLDIINNHIRVELNSDACFIYPVLIYQETLGIDEKAPLLLSIPYRDGTMEDSRRKERIPLPIANPELEVKRKRDLECMTDLTCRLPDIVFHTVKSAENPVICIEISESGTIVACGLENSTIRTWDLLSSQSNELIGHSGTVFALSIDLDKKTLISGSEDCSIRLWSLAIYTAIAVYRFHSGPVWSVHYSTLGHYFASGSHDKTACIWVTDNTGPLRLLTGHLSDVNIVRFHPSMNYIGSASSDRTVRLWDVLNGYCVRVIVGHIHEVLSIAFSPLGRVMYTGDSEGWVKAWQMDACLLDWELKYLGAVEAIAVSQNNEAVACGYNTCKLVLVSTEGKVLKEICTKQTPVIYLGFNWRNLLVSAGSC